MPASARSARTLWSHQAQSSTVCKTGHTHRGRLYHFRQAWQNITTDQWTQSVIRSGFRIQFRVRPKLARVVPQFLRKPPADPEKIRLIQEEIESMLEKPAIEPVSSHHLKGGYGNYRLSSSCITEE